MSRAAILPKINQRQKVQKIIKSQFKNIITTLKKMFSKARQFISTHKYKILTGICCALAGYAFYQYSNDQSRIRLSAFLQALKTNQLSQVVIQGDTVHFKSELSQWYHTCLGKYPVYSLFEQLKNAPNLKYSCQEDYGIMRGLVPLGLSAAVSLIAMKWMMPEQFSKNNKHPKIVHNHQTFQHFYGSEEVKLKLKELMEYLSHKEKYKMLGGRIRRGILLHGPPGTGKTMLAKTLANQANLPFIQTCASQFEQIFVGVGAKKIRDIFHAAKRCKQGCIIFIDQLDAIGSRTDNMRSSRQTTATINQLLTQLDGFEQNQNIVVIGATNRMDLVDSALIRAGRFDIKVKLHLPNNQQRKGIFETLLRKKNVPNEISDVAIDKIAQKSFNWSGADLQALINEGIYKAVRECSPVLRDNNVMQAMTEMLVK